MTMERNRQVQVENKEAVFAQAAEFFERAKNVPYVLGLDGNPNRLFVENAGNCTRKHFYLASRLQTLGYQVALGVAEFDWRNLPIPTEITSLLKNPVDSHLFLYATYGNGEMIVDATWDSGMPQGFLVNTWNGHDNTQIGVPAIRIYRENYQLTRAKALMGSVVRSVRQDRKPTPFNDAFNEWLHRR
ncbi:MAG: hypothetical protein AAB546_02485 [Patescibacteria group bacterium]